MHNLHECKNPGLWSLHVTAGTRPDLLRILLIAVIAIALAVVARAWGRHALLVVDRA